MEDNPLQKFADAYEEYRKRQRKKNLMALLGTLGIGAAGLWGLSRFRGAQMRRIAQQAARRRRLLGGGAALAGLGMAAPFVFGGNDSIADQLSMLPDSIKSLLGTGAQLNLRSLFNNNEVDAGLRSLQDFADSSPFSSSSPIPTREQREAMTESASGITNSIGDLFSKIL